METNNQRVSQLSQNHRAVANRTKKPVTCFTWPLKFKKKTWGENNTRKPPCRRLFTVHYCTNANKNMTPKIVTVWRLLLLLFLLLAHSATVRNHVQHLFFLSLSLFHVALPHLPWNHNHPAGSQKPRAHQQVQISRILPHPCFHNHPPIT